MFLYFDQRYNRFNHKVTVIGDVDEELEITEKRIIVMTKTVLVVVAPRMIKEVM